MVLFSSSRKGKNVRSLCKQRVKLMNMCSYELIIGFIGTLCLLTALRWPCAGPAARGARIPTFNAVQ